MKKTIIALVLSMLMICSLALSVFASTTTSFSVTHATGGRGETVTLSVVVSNMPEVNSLGIDFSYDSSVLEVVNGQWSVAGAMLTSFDIAKAKAGAAWMAPTASTGTIFTITFKVKDNAAFGTTAVAVTLIPTKNGAAAIAPAQQVATVTIACSHTATENRPEQPATCSLPGTAAGVFCTGCNTYISGGTPIPATGLHVDADNKWETNETEHWHTCSCGEIIDKVAHTGGTATCVAKAQCTICGVAYGDINATNHKVSTQQLAEDKYLVAGSGANCKDYKKYYYACVYCQAPTTESWTSTVLGEHDYGELVQAKDAVHTPDALEPAVAAYYKCSVCEVYFTEAKVATTLPELTGETPTHTFGGFKADAQKHWKECACGLKNSEGNHVFDNDADMVCDTCTYDRSCTHPKALEYVAALEANCTVDGNVEYWYCVDCLAKFDAATAAGANKIADATVPALGHKFAEIFTFENGKHWKVCTNANCTVVSEDANCSGGKATCQVGAVCDICKNTYTDVAAHDFATIYTTAAGSHWRACQTAGCDEVTDQAVCAGGEATCIKLAECAVCGKEYGELKDHVLSTGFDYKDSTGHALVCTFDGCTYHDAIQPHDGTEPDCEVCGYVYHTCGVDMTYIPALVGTCLQKGHDAYYVCSCEKLYYDVAATKVLNSITEIEAYGEHSVILVPGTLATCTESGTSAARVCAACGLKFTFSQTVPALGHNWSEWTTTLEPTDFAEGSKSRTCANCNETETAAIPALGHEHTVVELPAVDATCTATGLTAGAKCEVCGEILKAQEEVAMIAHATEKVDAKAATATEDGNVEYWTCTACAGIWLDEQLTTVATKEETVIPATGEVVIEAPSAEEGSEATVIVSGTGIAAGTKLDVTYKPAEEFAHISVTVEGKKGNIKQVVDINLQLDGNKVQPDGSVQVKLYIDVELRNIENLGIIHIAEDGTIEFITAERQGNYLVFNTNHFSNYAVVELIEAPTTEPEETTAAPEETTAAPEETTAAPEETTAAPEETTAAPEDITVPEETTAAPEDTTVAPEETTAAPEETTSPEVPSTGDNAIFFIVSIIAMATIFTAVVSLKKRNDN